MGRVTDIRPGAAVGGAVTFSPATDGLGMGADVLTYAMIDIARTGGAGHRRSQCGRGRRSRQKEGGTNNGRSRAEGLEATWAGYRETA